jgi:hypothetical protein
MSRQDAIDAAVSRTFGRYNRETLEFLTDKRMIWPFEYDQIKAEFARIMNGSEICT